MPFTRSKKGASLARRALDVVWDPVGSGFVAEAFLLAGAAFQQVAIAAGVAVAGLILELGMMLRGASVPSPDDFTLAFVVVGATTGLVWGTQGAWHTALVPLAGVITAVPLLLFAAGARRAPLTVIGLLQFVAPILQFITGAWIMQEPMPLERWIGFGLVWIALIVLSADSLISARRTRAASDVADLV